MKFLQCSHPPHTMKITFDMGNDQISEYTLCKNCKNVPVFRDFILSKETFTENTQVTGIEGHGRPHSISAQDVIDSG